MDININSMSFFMIHKRLRGCPNIILKFYLWFKNSVKKSAWRLTYLNKDNYFNILQGHTENACFVFYNCPFPL